jgi:FkbM family methyltransferase
MKSLLRFLFSRLLRFYPLKSGCGLIANTKLFKSFSQTSTPLLLAKLRDGSSIYINLDQYIGRSIYYFGDFDPKITWVCRQVLRHGDTALDIGANIGLVTLCMANLVGKSGTVHAFEPQPILAKMLQSSIDINGFEQIRLHCVALSTEDSILKMQVPIANDGAASLEFWASASANEIDVDVRNADPYLARLKLQKVRLVKIDVEGHESFVLKGSKQFLSSCKPDIIIFEEHRKPLLAQESVIFLGALDYIVYELPKSWFRVRPILLSTQNSYSSHDCIAIHRKVMNESMIKLLNLRG